MNKRMQDFLMDILRDIVWKQFILLPFYGIGRTFVLMRSGTGAGLLGGVLGIIPFIGAGFCAYWGLGVVFNLASTPASLVSAPCTRTALGLVCVRFQPSHTNYVTLVIGVAILIALTILVERIGYSIQDAFEERAKVKLPEFKD